MLTFPTLPTPLSPESDTNSAKHDRVDSTIITTTDANYIVSRPRATRRPQKWTLAWHCLTDEQYNTLDVFYAAVGLSEMFYFTPPFGPTAGTQTIVRIATKAEWQRYFAGWQGSITFQEV